MSTNVTLVSGKTVATSDLYVQDVKGNYTLLPHAINCWTMDVNELLVSSFTFNSFDVTSLSGVESFMMYINTLCSGIVVCVIVVGDLRIHSTTARLMLYSVFERIGGAKICQVSSRKPNYCLVGYKGQCAGQAIEVVGKSTVSSQIKVTADMEKRIYANKNKNTKTIQIKACFYNASCPIVLVNGVRQDNIKGGMNVITFDNYNNVDMVYAFDTGAPVPAASIPGRSIDTSSTPAQQLASFVQDMNKSVVTLMFTYGQTKYNLTQQTVDTIKQAFSSRFINDYYDNNSNQCWYLIGRKENTNPYAEATTQSGEFTCSYFYTLYDGDNDGNTHLSAYSYNTPMLCPYNNLFIVNDVNLESNKNFQGMVLAKIDQVDGTLINLQYFNMNNGSEDSSDIGSINDMVNAINAIPTGTLVMVSVSKLNVPYNFEMPINLVDALSTLGACYSNSINYRSSYCLIGRKGSSSGSSAEDISTTGPVNIFSNFNSKTNITSPSIVIKSISSKRGSEFFINGRKVPIEYKCGMNVLVVDPMNGNIKITKNFNTIIGNDADEESNQLSQFIESLPVGSIVALSNQGTTSLNQRAKQTISKHLRGGNNEQHQLESSSIYQFNENKSYCSIGKIVNVYSNNNNNNNGQLSNESLNNEDDQQSTCLLHYPLDYLFQNVQGYNINVKSKAGLNSLAQIQINGVDVVSRDNLSLNGLNVVIIKPGNDNHSLNKFNVVDDENQWFAFYEFVLSLPLHTLVVIAIQSSFGEISNEINRYYMKLAFKMIGGSMFNDRETSYAMIGCKGIASSSAHELCCTKSSLVSVSSWEPKYRDTDNEMKEIKTLVGRDALFSVPLFEYYYKLSNPINKYL